MATKMFGEMLKELRLQKELTLRKFCQMSSLDPGNVSRWERGITDPPQSQDTLNRIAAILGLEKDTEEYDDFMTAAALSKGRLPQKILDDDELLKRLPIFFRTLDGRKLTQEQFEALIKILREEL